MIMYYNAGKVLVIEGDVKVTQYNRGGRFVKSRVYESKGVSVIGNPQKALNNMRLNAKYKFMYENQIGSDIKLKTQIINYKIKNRDFYNTKTKRVNRNGKYYFETYNSRGDLINSGKWSSEKLNIEDYIDDTDET
jgi:hypothetical protein